jgi:PAS domain S-box-containing protein
MARDLIPGGSPSLDTQLFRASAKHVPMLVFTADPSGRIDFVTERWTSLTGASAESLLDFGFVRLLHPEDRPAALASWRRHVEHELPYVEEWRFRRSDGTFRYLEVCAEPRRDRGGDIVGWYGAAVDVDVRRRAMDALALLAESGASLATADDVGTLLERVARAVLEGIAEVSMFEVSEPGSPAPRRHLVTSNAVSAAEKVALEAFRSPPVSEASLTAIVDDAYLAKHVRDPAAIATWRAIGITSVVVAPLRVAGRTIGSLTLLRTHSGVPFEPADRALVEEIGRRVAVAIDNVRLAGIARDAARERDEHFHKIADSMPHLMWTANADGSIEWANQRWTDYTGQPLAVAIDTDARRAAYHPDDLAQITAAWDVAVANAHSFETETRLRRHDGVYRWFLYRAEPVVGADGSVRWYGSSIDIHDARRTARAMRTFADIGIGVGESLGLQQTLSRVMQAIVPEFADWGFINLRDDAGDLRVAAIYHTDARARALLASMIGKIYARGTIRRGTPEALRSGRPLLIESASFADADGVVEPDILNVFWRSIGFRSVFSVPLVVGTEPRGALTLLMSREGERSFTEADVPFFEELARRIAPAIGNAEAYEREHRVAQSFQRAALPATLPQRTGLTFDAMYAAGRNDALVGGDWYDAFVIADGRIVVSIGDVAGSGLLAAVVMSNVRQTIRGVAQVHADPKLMLASADAALREESPDYFVTAFVGVIDSIEGTIDYATAGHPPPLLRIAGTMTALDDANGPPLGLRDGGDASASRRVPLGSLLVLYTDGLIEATRDIAEGEESLRRVFAAMPAANPNPASYLYDAVLPLGARDDVAILTVAFRESDAVRHWTIDPRDPVATNAVRGELVAALRADCHDESELPFAELILAELVANLTRYAPGNADLVLECVGSRSVLHVLDAGPGFTFVAKLPNDVFAESGRGLFLVASLARDFSVSRRHGGGSHARVVFRS